jgi:hypothetical protein
MVRTWLLRGCAVAIFVVLVGAWAAGVIGHGDEPVPTAQLTTPDEPGRPPVTRVQPGSVLERAPHRHHRKARRGDEPSPSSTPSADDDPTTEAPSTPSPSDPPHTPDPSDDPSDPSDDPSHSSSPSDDPSPTPSDPDDECTTVLDCVLDPITRHP